MAASPLKSPNTSRLFSLPRELRDEIYSYTISSARDPTSQNGKTAKYIPNTHKCSDHKRLAFRPPPLIQTSRQLRAEASEVFYKNTIFLDDSYGGRSCLAWLKSLDKTSRSLIKFIALVESTKSCFPLFFPKKPVTMSFRPSSALPLPLDRVRIRGELVRLGVDAGAVRFLQGKWADQASEEEEMMKILTLESSRSFVM